MYNFKQYITPDCTISVDIELKSILKNIDTNEFIKSYKISNIWRGKFFIKKIINKVFKYQLQTPMNWNKDFWESIKVDLMNTNLDIDANNLLSILESKTTKKRFKDIKKYQKLITHTDMGPPVYITGRALNMIGGNIDNKKVFILDGSRRLVANILNNTNPNVLIIDKKSISNEH